MSVAAMAKVWELDLPRDQKLVLMAFADHANDAGYVFAGIARISWKCGYTQKRSVAAIVRKLGTDGVLDVVEKAHGRTPTLYRIRWDRAKQLAEFDPLMFKTDRGAENAPQEPEAEMSNSDDPKSLTDQEEIGRSGAENAPQADGVQKTHPIDSVGVQSGARRGAISARRGAVATAPEPLTINQRRAGARASQSRAAPAQEHPPPDPELFKLNNSARNLGIEPKTANEPLEHFQQRINEAHVAKLQRMADAQAAAPGTA